jgi:hypothetical protein
MFGGQLKQQAPRRGLSVCAVTGVCRSAQLKYGTAHANTASFVSIRRICGHSAFSRSLLAMPASLDENLTFTGKI